jgi:hypothetical protein
VHRFRCTEERELEDLSSSPSSSLFLKNEKSENAEEEDDALTIVVVPPLTALLFFRVVVGTTLDDASLEEDGSVARIILCACVYGERAQARALFFGAKSRKV